MKIVSSFSERLAEAMNGMGVTELATKLGVSKQSVSAWLNGTRQPKQLALTAMAQMLSVHPAWLMGYDVPMERKDWTPTSRNPHGVMPIDIKRVPLLGRIACGEPIYAEEQHGEFMSVSADLDVDFCLQASGDSMTGARIYDGDIVFCRSQNTVDNGQIAAVVINDEATLKRVYYYPDKSKLILNPENPSYEPMVYVGSELNDVHIIGLAVAFQSTIR